MLRVSPVVILIGFLRIIKMKSCAVDRSPGYSLTKYYKDECPHCTKITPFIEELNDKIDFIRFNSTNCNNCDCEDLNIKGVPTLILRKDGKEIDRLRGYQDFHRIVAFLGQAGVSPEMVRSKVVGNSEVQTLYERDFYKALEGPWIILFYSSKGEKMRELLKEAAEKYSGRVRFGEISKNSSANLIHRFNISVFPTILAMNDGILAGYNGKPDISSLSDFIDRLIAPSFKEINLEEFDQMAENISDPIFVVFTIDLMLANSYFRRAAHEYKLHTRIYKTTDPALFDRANIHPKSGKDEESVVLAVYKNGIFHRFPHTITSEKLAEWIYHTHFPHLTRITNENFYAVFHGIKSSIILITQNGQYMDIFEDVALKTSLGLPYTEHLFATLDADEYSLFIPQLLPGLKAPVITIFDPRRQLFFYKKINFEKNLDLQINNLIKQYEAGKLQPYPAKTHWSRYFIYISLAVVVIGIVTILLKKEEKLVD